jgi:hypothetical protein
MKLLNKKLTGLLCAVFLLSGFNGFSQAAEKGSPNIVISYFVVNNKIPYLMVKVNTKINGKFTDLAGINLKLFLDKDSAGTFIGNAVTNEKGQAFSNIPPSVKTEWDKSVKHTFLATFAGNDKYEAAKAELQVSRAKLLIDANSDKTVTASLYELKDAAWVPVKGVDVVLAVKRLFADLPINDKPTFTTDSTGKASGDFKRDSIPGDEQGNITLVASVIDNDPYGNLRIEKTVPWGAKFTSESDFNKRTLFATRNKTPIWLAIIATAIIIGVWGVLIMLVVNIFRIKKLGKEV